MKFLMATDSRERDHAHTEATAIEVLRGCVKLRTGTLAKMLTIDTLVSLFAALLGKHRKRRSKCSSATVSRFGDSTILPPGLRGCSGTREMARN